MRVTPFRLYRYVDPCRHKKFVSFKDAVSDEKNQYTYSDSNVHLPEFKLVVPQTIMIVHVE